MRDKPDDPRPSVRDEWRASSAVAIVFWTLFQIVSLLLIAARVQLCARPGRATDADGLALMLMVQASVAALLFPRLLRGWAQALLVGMSATAFLQLAALMDRAAPQALIASIALTWLWLAALWVARQTLTNRRWEIVGISVAATTICSAGLLRYLRLEFAQKTETSSFHAVFASICVAILGCSTIILMLRPRATRYPQVVH